jgi:hypothetical protein
VLAILPVAAFGLLLAALRGSFPEWRSRCLAAALIWGLFIAAGTEILSEIGWITRGGVALAWLFFCAGALWAAKISVPAERGNQLADAGGGDVHFRWLLWGAGVVAGIAALTAILSPPNTRDAMVYHLPRVVEWINNRSIDFYPTVDYQQLTMAPWAEYVMLHLDLLYGGDRLVNLVQWFGYAGSIVGVSLIAGALGADRRGQIFAAVCCATLPTAVLAASGPKNDLVLTFWLVTGVYFLLRWKAEPDWKNTLAYGTAFALAIFTKATAMVFLPCVVAACWWMARPPERWQFIRRLPAVALLVIAINAPLMIRNYRLSGSPLGFASAGGDADTEGKKQFTNSAYSIGSAASNVIRNLALHVGTPVDSINRRLQAGAVWIIHALGQDPNDAAMLADGKTGLHFPFQVVPMNRHETQAGNLLHFSYAILAFGILLYYRRKTRAEVWLLSAGIAGAFVLFCATVRWMPTNGRLHLPVFILGAAVLGAVLPAFCPRRVTALLGAVLLIGSLPFALANKARPLVTFGSLHDDQAETMRYGNGSIFQRTRQQLYFGDAANILAPSYMAASKEVLASGCRRVGIDASMQHYEYPILALIRSDTAGPAVQYVGVSNRSATYHLAGQEAPCMVVCPGCAKDPAKVEEYKTVGGQMAVFGDVVVFGASGQRDSLGGVQRKSFVVGNRREKEGR